MTYPSPHNDGSGFGHAIGSIFLGVSLAAIAGAVLVLGTFTTMFAIAVCHGASCL